MAASPSAGSLKDQFLLEPEVVFLNHGSFGACPQPVFEAYQRIQLELERQPVRFLNREFRDRMAAARAELAAYLGANADDLVYVPNVTTAINIVARSLDLQPGDEVLGTTHEYGALERTWRFVCGKAGARYVRAPISVPVTSAERIVDEVWSCVTKRTHVLFLSHITSPTALVLPIAPLIAKAREAGILTIIDGAHAPGQIPLNLDALGADAYAGNCHKWMLAPKGSAFLHMRRAAQDLVDPLVVSWGWESDQPGPSRFIDFHEWQGTRDMSTYLAVPAAIRYLKEHDWTNVAARCRRLLHDEAATLLSITGQEALSPVSPDWVAQMMSFPIPTDDAEAFQRRLYDEHRIEAPAIRWNDRTLLRVSVNAYNDAQDMYRLRNALRDLLERP
jgi:isopenicillin-N epimerase